MKKLFVVILLLFAENLFAKTWTRTLQGYDCYYGDCDAYADSSNVMYNQHYVSHEHEANSATIVFNDSAMLFGAVSDGHFGKIYPGTIYFSLYLGLAGCGALGSHVFCEYSFTVSVGADTANSEMDSLWLQRKPGFLFEDTLDLADTSQFVALVDTLEFLTKFFPRYYREGWLYKEEEVPLSYERRYYYIVNDADSFYFVYRRDSSYFAYCQMLQSRNCGAFQLQCIFQTDSLPYFPAFDVASYPYPSWSGYWISSNSPSDEYHSGACLSKEEAMELNANALPPRRGDAPKNVEGKSYRTNGSPSSENYTGVVIENGKAKFQRKK